MSAHARDALAAARGHRAVRLRRRGAPLRGRSRCAGADGVQGALLRLGAGLPVAAGAAADALRRAVRGVHGVREVQRGREVLPGRAAHLDRALHLLLRRHQRRGDLGAGPREPGAQDPVPARRGAAGHGAHRVLQPAHQPGGGGACSCWPPACSRNWTWLLASRSCCSLLVRAGRRRVDAAVGAVRALPRRAADLGRGAPGAVLRLADPVRDRDRSPARRPARS